MDIIKLKEFIKIIGKDLFIQHKEGKIIFFCGAGISKQGSNIPTFQELLEQIIQEKTLDEVDKHQYLNNPDNKLKNEYKNKIDIVFNILCENYGQNVIDTLIKNIIKQSSQISDYHHNILQLSNHNNLYKIITTNFDLLFEQQVENNKLDIPKYTSINIPHIIDFNKKGGIIYLHNTIECDDIIYTQNDLIENYIVKNRIREFLLSLFAEYTIIFLGYSLQDLLVNYIVSGISNKNHYLFTTEDKNNKNNKTITNKLPKNITSVNFENYNELAQCINTWSQFHQQSKEEKADLLLKIINYGYDENLEIFIEYFYDYNLNNKNSLVSIINNSNMIIHCNNLLYWLKHYNEVKNDNITTFLFDFIYFDFIHNKNNITNEVIDFIINNNIKLNSYSLAYHRALLYNICIMPTDDYYKLKLFNYLESYINDDKSIVIEQVFRSIKDKNLLIKYLNYNKEHITYKENYTNQYLLYFHNYFPFTILNEQTCDEINSYFISALFLNKNNNPLDIEVENYTIYTLGDIHRWFTIIKKLLSTYQKKINPYFKYYCTLAKNNPDIYIFKQLILYLGKEFPNIISFKDVYKYAITPIYKKRNNNINYMYYDRNIFIYLIYITENIPLKFKHEVLENIEKTIKKIESPNFKITTLQQDSFYIKDLSVSENKNIILKNLKQLQINFNDIFEGKADIKKYYRMYFSSKEISYNTPEIIEKAKKLTIHQVINLIEDSNPLPSFSDKDILTCAFIKNNYTDFLEIILKQINQSTYNITLITKVLQNYENKEHYPLLPDIIYKFIKTQSNIIIEDHDLLYDITKVMHNKIFYKNEHIDNTIEVLTILFNLHNSPTKDIKNKDFSHGILGVVTAEDNLIKQLIQLLFFKPKSDDESSYIFNENYLNKLQQNKQLYHNVLNRTDSLGNIYRNIIVGGYYNFFDVINNHLNNELLYTLLPFYNIKKYKKEAVILLNNSNIFWYHHQEFPIEYIFYAIDYLSNNNETTKYEIFLIIFIYNIILNMNNKDLIYSFNKMPLPLTITTFEIILKIIKEKYSALQITFTHFKQIINQYLSKKINYKAHKNDSKIDSENKNELILIILEIGLLFDEGNYICDWLLKNNYKLTKLTDIKAFALADFVKEYPNKMENIENINTLINEDTLQNIKNKYSTIFNKSK